MPGVLMSSASAKTVDGTLNCTVGPGFTISMDATDGLAPGTYTLQIHDKSDLHNCDLVGTGCASPVDQSGEFSCTVTLAAGTTYTYQCDAHPTQMKGTFTTAGGNPPPSPPPPPPPAPPPPPPKPKKLLARIGDTGRPTLTTAAGKKFTKLTAGRYNVIVRDTSKKHDFHLTGPGVNKSTGIAAKRTFTWKLNLRKGTYTYRDDAAPKVKKTFKVVPKKPL